MSELDIFSPGKIILSGEHAVVYGHPAIVSTTNLGVQVSIKAHLGTYKLSSAGYGKPLLVTGEKLRSYWLATQKRLSLYHLDGDITSLHQVLQRKLALVQLAVGQFLDRFPDILGKSSSVEIKVNSSLPKGSGMGSSAAVVYGVTLAMAQYFSKRLTKTQLSQMVYAVEEVIHGTPSGIDNTAIVYGGVLRFCKTPVGKFEHTKIQSKSRLPEVLLIHSGKPTENTGQMVSIVKAKKDADPKKFGEMFSRMATVTQKLQGSIEHGLIDKELLTENQRLLEEIGVVGSRAQEIVRSVELVGGGAKVCGAGGIQTGSGIVLAVAEEISRLELLAKQKKWRFWKIRLGE